MTDLLLNRTDARGRTVRSACAFAAAAVLSSVPDAAARCRRAATCALAAAAVPSSGCATAINGSTQLVAVAAARCRRAATCAFAAAAVLSSGCATTINGSTQLVAVASDPPGARVFIGDRAVGVTPTRLELNRGARDLALRFEKDCYRDVVLPVPRRTSQWVAGNALFAGIPINEYTWGPWLAAMAFYTTVGALMDWRSGGAFTFPDLVRATLERLPVAPGAADHAVSRSGEGVEPAGGCAPAAAAGDPPIQGNTPRDR